MAWDVVLQQAHHLPCALQGLSLLPGQWISCFRKLVSQADGASSWGESARHGDEWDLNTALEGPPVSGPEEGEGRAWDGRGATGSCRPSLFPFLLPPKKLHLKRFPLGAMGKISSPYEKDFSLILPADIPSPSCFF